MATVVASFLGYTGYEQISNNCKISNDTQKIDSPDAVNVDSSIDPLPVTIEKPVTQPFQLIGYGIRQVTFLHMNVYALGLYIAKEDLSLVKQIFNSRYLESLYEKPNPELSQKEALEKALEDNKLSTVLIENLLNAGVRFTARICALRNTDLSHLRDGFVRTIKNSDRYKEIMKQNDEQSEKLAKGVDELRSVMNSHRMKAYRNSRVFMEIIDQGKIRISVKIWDRNHFRDPVVMGIVEEPLVSKLLFSCYLSGANPLVGNVRKTAAENLVSMF
ncbi:hypothetical protein FOA43_001099 [Brettanomyces nanus]|uniref:Altered inheritance of mitochondria protein 18, mitochondrial n=1 Tax=Eeniella nana TaxID=13502 RepID=A0A875S0E0_EENNA|nr:uncharacterized protein FOA43_001099 [Brettanomyces nanus]QPG73785.1 hypothetical protein FOA43_001099 [Brettanomyces nanus]